MAKTGSKTYTVVTDQLRDKIASGEYEPNTWLSETQLIGEYGITRYAARQVIQQLALEGLVVVQDGKGSYVRARRDRVAHTDHRDLTTTGSTGTGVQFADTDTPGWEPVETPGTYRADATDDIALAMGVPAHTPLFVHDRLLGSGARRVSHRLYLPLSTCLDNPALTENPYREPAQVYGLLAEQGHHLRFVDTIRAALPTGDDAASLRIPAGQPVLITRRLVTDHTGRGLVLEETRRNGEDTQLAYTLTPLATR